MPAKKSIDNGESQDQPPAKDGSFQDVTADAVFGEITENGPNYRGVHEPKTSP